MCERQRMQQAEQQRGALQRPLPPPTLSLAACRSACRQSAAGTLISTHAPTCGGAAKASTAATTQTRRRRAASASSQYTKRWVGACCCLFLPPSLPARRASPACGSPADLLPAAPPSGLLPAAAGHRHCCAVGRGHGAGRGPPLRPGIPHSQGGEAQRRGGGDAGGGRCQRQRRRAHRWARVVWGGCSQRFPGCSRQGGKAALCSARPCCMHAAVLLAPDSLLPTHKLRPPACSPLCAGPLTALVNRMKNWMLGFIQARVVAYVRLPTVESEPGSGPRSSRHPKQGTAVHPPAATSPALHARRPCPARRPPDPPHPHPTPTPPHPTPPTHTHTQPRSIHPLSAAGAWLLGHPPAGRLPQRRLRPVRHLLRPLPNAVLGVFWGHPDWQGGHQGALQGGLGQEEEGGVGRA